MKRSDLSADRTVAFDPKTPPVERINKLIKILCQKYLKAHEQAALRNMQCVRANEEGQLEFEVFIAEGLCNTHRVLHGSAFTLIFDMYSTAAMVVISKPGLWAIGHEPHEANFVNVSRNLNSTVLRAVPLGSKASVMTKPLHIGAHNALLQCGVLDKSTGSMLGHGTHDMVIPMRLTKENEL